MAAVLTVVLAYLLGSIPTGYLLMKWGKGIDIRKAGSGNIGMTNVTRVAGWRWGLPVLLLDIGKGALAVGIPWFLFPGHLQILSLQVLGGFIVMLGNIFPIFLNFKGGKGVGTGLGVFGTLLPVPTLTAIAVFAVVVGMTRMVSLGSLTGTLTMASLAWILHIPFDALNVFAFLAVVVVVWTHRANIQRILAGTENKIGARKTSDAPEASIKQKRKRGGVI